MKIRGWKGPKEQNRGGKAGSKREAGVGGVLCNNERRTRRGAPLRMHACRVVADQETVSEERVRESEHRIPPPYRTK